MRSLLHAASVGEQDVGKALIPISPTLLHGLGKHVRKGTVEPFQQPIPLRVIGNGVHLSQSLDLANVFQQ